ncbi:MBG domain-containing protein, partial [Ferruginibacter sp.]|uniref:MBG domain-containing protein n=1 Tax=Ferruginibacter sp. TaxID=1940288 RepID=UPI0019BF159F
SKVYGVTLTNTDYTGSITGIVAGDVISVTRASTGDAANATVAGSTYPIIGTLVDAGNRLANYTVSNPNGALTVTKKALLITANDRTKTYGDAVTFAGTEFTSHAGDLVNSDAVASVTLSSAGAAATATVTTPGPIYTITPSLATGSGLGNYSISYAPGTLTIVKATLTITAANANKYCGQSNPSFTGSYSGQKNSETFTLSFSTSATAASGAGNYAIVPSVTGTTLSNYTIIPVNGMLTINAITGIDASASSTPVPLGTSALLSATITPAVGGVPVTFTLDNGNGGIYTYSTTTSSAVGSVGMATISASGLPVEVYKITAVAGANCATSSAAYLPVYDPNGGFVTGGGWIISPIVPSLPYMQVSGKANFGFSSKYKKGSNIPDGNTEFQFQEGNLNFSSSSYSTGSLVIAGSQAIYQGVGTINGVAGYSFMVSAVDGQVNGGGNIDKFRMKIWNTSTSAIVYDNNAGLDNNGTPTTAIAGGSIVIHNANGGAARVVITPAPVSAAVTALEAKVMPNPTTSVFNLIIKGKAAEPVTVRVTDVYGNIIQLNQKIGSSATLRLGERWTNGTYFVEVMQGNERKLLKVIKAN